MKALGCAVVRGRKNWKSMEKLECQTCRALTGDVTSDGRRARRPEGRLRRRWLKWW